jgi:hypothetical protein
MNLTSHLRTVPTLNEWSYTSTSSTWPHGVDRETLHFTSHPHQEGCDFRVFPGLWCVGEQAAVRPVAEGRAEVKGIIRNLAQGLARQRQAVLLKRWYSCTNSHGIESKIRHTPRLIQKLRSERPGASLNCDYVWSNVYRYIGYIHRRQNDGSSTSVIRHLRLIAI